MCTYIGALMGVQIHCYLGGHLSSRVASKRVRRLPWIISGLPKDATWSEVKEHFERIGNVGYNGHQPQIKTEIKGKERKKERKKENIIF